MRNITDLTGQRFGKLIAIERANDRPRGTGKSAYWLCKCDCGNEKIIRSDSLKNGTTESCGSCWIFKDLTGQRFGRLLVIKKADTPEGKRKSTYWLCRCDCGNEKVILGYHLRYEKTISCGCYRKEKARETNFKNLVGIKFGRLTVIELATPTTEKGKQNYRTYWLCKCDCGNEKIADGASLKSGHITSCGCYKKEIQSLPYGKASENTVFTHYKCSARKRNLDFKLSRENFLELTKQNCFYCGKKPSAIAKSGFNTGDYIYNGIDRIDSSKGYTIENCVPCCGICNQAKMAETQSDFFEWIKTVYDNLSNKGLI